MEVTDVTWKVNYNWKEKIDKHLELKMVIEYLINLLDKEIKEETYE